MSLKIRLTRGGAKKRPYYHIVIADSHSPRDGKFIEKVGAYNPMLPKDGAQPRVTLKSERIAEWLGKGAQTLGLEGRIDARQFEAVLKGLLPDGSRVGNDNRVHRAGTDLTFSMPKSWSLLALVGGDRRILDAYSAAVKETLAWAEKNLAETRMEVRGKERVLATGNLPPHAPPGIDPAARIMREETFGPVAAVSTFDTEAEAISRANDTDYGLVAYVVTANGARQLRLARALEFGMVAINRVKITGAPVPFGGWKCSGLGREGARHGLEAFTELKYVCIDTRAEAAA